MTKAEAKANRAAWSKAINEGRVVRINWADGTQTFRECSSAQDAQQYAMNTTTSHSIAKIVTA